MTPSRPWTNRSIPNEVARIPAMLSDEERRYLSWVTAESFEGFGAVVDLGPWLGASTAALAHGLREADRDEKVLAYDLFEWRQNYMDGYVDDETARGFDEGDSFLPLFEDQLGPYRDQVETRPGSLLDTVWHGGPIEILFVDAAKDFALTNAILRTFGPALVPGRSRVISQDFRIHAAYWLPWVFDGHPDQWRELERTDYGSTVTFVPTHDYEHKELRDDDLSLPTAEPILRRRIADDLPENRVHFANSLYRIAILRGDQDFAAALEPELRELGRHNPSAQSPDEVASAAFSQLISEGWDALRSGDHDTVRGRVEAARRSEDARAEAEYLLALAEERATESDLASRLRLTGAGSLLQAGRAEHAAREVLLALEHPTDPPTGWELRWAFETLEPAWSQATPPDPLAVLDELAPRYEETPPFHLLRALVLNLLGRVDEAREAIDCVLALDPDYRRGLVMRDELRAG